MTDSSRAADGGRSTLPRGMLIGALLGIVLTAQALAIPRQAGPDEPAHVRRAAGIVRGQLTGDEVARPDGTVDEAARSFRLPWWVGEPEPGCYAQLPETPVSCSAVTPIGSASARLESTAATNPPWAHVLPGIGTLGPGRARTLWLSRVLGLLVPLALVTMVIARTVSLRRPLATAAVLLALTPMSLFVFAVVNPSGWAVSGALAAWSGAIAVARAEPNGSMLFATGWTVGVLGRNDGLMWLVAALCIVLLVGRCSPRAFWRRLAVVPRWVAVAASVVAVGWTLAVPPALVSTGDYSDESSIDLVASIVSRTGFHLRSAVGVLGWLDTAIPETAYVLWWMLVGTLAGAALVRGSIRSVTGAALTFAAFVVLSWLIEFSQVRSVGLYWQGRYALPLLIGVPLLLGMSSAPASSTEPMTIDGAGSGSVDELSAPQFDSSGNRIGPIVAASAVVIWNAAFLQALRRWGVGQSGSFAPWSWDTWSTPVPLEVLIVAHIAASVGLWWVCVGGRVPILSQVTADLKR
jgi:hypothetical protein